MQGNLRISTKAGRAFKLYGLFLLLKFALEYSYFARLHEMAPSWWPLDFHPMKYVYGFFFFTVLFLGISHERKLASTFLLQFLFVFQIIPITVIYALTNGDTLYYSTICFSFVACEGIVFYMSAIHSDIRMAYYSQGRFIIWGLWWLLLFFLIYIYQTNGFPSLMALNIYDVYKLRGSDVYSIGKYGFYLQTFLIKIGIPILLTKYLLDKRYVLVIILIGMTFIVYLYTGVKSHFFVILLVIGTVVLAMKDNFPERFWKLFCWGMSLLVAAVVLKIPFAGHVFSLLVRRVLMDPAQLCFYHFEFFLTHPLLGMAGIFPRWLFFFQNPYEGMEPYEFQIGRIFYGWEGMGANNGFLSEGFSHFGFIGIFLNLILFALILKLIDGFQEKTSYVSAVGYCINAVYGLVNGPLLVPFGYIGAWLLFMACYRPSSALHFKLSNEKLWR